MEALKTLLGDELFNQVTSKLAGKELFLHDKGQKVIVDDGTLIPKHRFDEVITQRDSFKTLAEQSERDLKALKTAAKGNEELTTRIEALQEANKQAKAEADANVLKTQKQFALKEALMNAGVVDPSARDLLALKFGEIELNQDGTVKRFDDLLKPIKENKTLASLFGENKIAGQEHKDGTTPGATSKLEADLAEAEKTGNTLKVISLKRMIAEENKTKV